MREAKDEEVKVIIPVIKLNLGIYKMSGEDCIVRRKGLSHRKCHNGGRLYHVTAEHPKYGLFSIQAAENEITDFVKNDGSDKE